MVIVHCFHYSQSTQTTSQHKPRMSSKTSDWNSYFNFNFQFIKTLLIVSCVTIGSNILHQFKSLPPFPSTCCFVPRLVKIGRVILEIVDCITIGSNILHKFKSLSSVTFTLGCFVPRLVKIGRVILEILKTLPMYFRYFTSISLCKEAWPFLWTDLKPNLSRIPCAKF